MKSWRRLPGLITDRIACPGLPHTGANVEKKQGAASGLAEMDRADSESPE
jgi:hypothetical protein